jgi:hypothetical protein
MPSKSPCKGARDLPRDARIGSADASDPHGPGSEPDQNPEEREYGGTGPGEAPERHWHLRRGSKLE